MIEDSRFEKVLIADTLLLGNKLLYFSKVFPSVIVQIINYPIVIKGVFRSSIVTFCASKKEKETAPCHIYRSPEQYLRIIVARTLNIPL